MNTDTTNPKSRGRLFTVWDGQFGSTGKGQIAWFISQQEAIYAAVRVGGPNAGHTFWMGRNKVVARTIPCVAYNGSTRGFIGAAGIYRPDVLIDELKRGFDLTGKPIKLTIDPNSVIITKEHVERERSLTENIGSTGEGVGAATADKVMRNPDITTRANLVKLEHWLPSQDLAFSQVRFPRESLSAVELNQSLQSGMTVMIEGTQGFGLGLHTGGFYPFCTSREVTPWALYSETGINPKNAEFVESVMVIRTYPIRVGGNSGPLKNEISWEELDLRVGVHIEPEKTTVTQRIRRIASMDYDLVKRAVLQGGPDVIALTFFDYVFPEAKGLTDPDKLEFEHISYIQDLERRFRTPIKYISTGPGTTLAMF